MDILLSIVRLEKERYEEITEAIKDSNLSTEIRWKIYDILDIALEQTKQAKNMGWL